jgi:hypothetical protein
MVSNFPIYIVSKGRYEKPLTAKLFEKANIDYLIVVESQEKENYVKALGEKRILVLTYDILGFERPEFSCKVPKKPFKINCHVYSAMLIKTDLPYRWRLKYNEDVDLCLQVLHNGGSTASCVYYLAKKTDTGQKMKGGNQDELYKGNDPKKKLLKAKMLEAVWPQYAKTVIKFNRYHHFVDWKVFKTKQGNNRDANTSRT